MLSQGHRGLDGGQVAGDDRGLLLVAVVAESSGHDLKLLVGQVEDNGSHRPSSDAFL